MKIVLISCVKQKRQEPCRAIDMYISPLFRGGVKYAHKIKYDKLFILSAKYGLLEENDFILPYNETLKNKTEKEKKLWAYQILNSLKAKNISLNSDRFIILAGNEYRKYICKKIKNYDIPLKGLSLGNQLKFYKNI